MSISIPKSVTECTDEMIELLIFKSCLCSFLSQLRIITWNLSRFIVISFILNQLMAVLLSFPNTLMSYSILLLAPYIVLSSAKFASSTSLTNKNKSFMKILNKMEPNIEPCCISDTNIWKTLSVSFIFTWKNKTRVTSWNPPVTSWNLRVRRLKVRVARLKAPIERLKAQVRRLKARVDPIKPRIK